MSISKIEWTDYTFNPWWGCARVSPACRSCYADTLATRYGHDQLWRRKGPRRLMSDTHWKQPLKWNRDAERDGTPKRVFCASMADVFEDHPDVAESRQRLWDLINATPWLHWQLLTKRPENVAAMAPWGNDWPDHVWLGTSVENQRWAETRIPHLLAIPAKTRFLSCEPLLGPVDLSQWMTPISPVPIEQAPKSWADWAWPGWVPKQVGDQVEGFWSERWGRGPRAWMRDMVEQGAPAFGSTVTMDNGFASNAPQVTGRFVHGWNNIGRLALNDGTFAYTSFGSRTRREQKPIAWAIIGGESGAKPRSMELSWAASLVSQAQAAGVPAFVKQLGTAWSRTAKAVSRKGGDPDEWPVELRVRRFPELTVAR
jgi:protein gp37